MKNNNWHSLYVSGIMIIHKDFIACLFSFMPFFFWILRLAKAEEDHQMAIREKLDLEVKLKEEMQITKVSLDYYYLFFFFCHMLN